MRNLLVAPVLASLVLSSTPADACGPYMPDPTIFKLSIHSVESRTQFARWETRTFVLTGAIDQARADQLSWKRLSSMPSTLELIADAPDLAQPMEVTLIGPGGTQVVSSKRSAFLGGTITGGQATSALEIEGLARNRFTFAIKGRHANAKWIAKGDARSATAADLAWVKKQNVKPVSSQYVHVSRLAGTELELVTVIAETTGTVTLVRSGKELWTRFDGEAHGAYQNGGQRYVLASLDGAVSAIWL